ncbi:MAG: isocitrate/isopropylmalate dehydrogenase family protein [Methanofastidiosum sp.]
MKKIAIMPGDGIGPEIIKEGKKVIDAACDITGLDIEWEYYQNGSEQYLKTGELITEETLKELKKKDAIYFGAIGDPRVAPGVLEKGILLKMRFYFDQYVNLRPIVSYPNVPCPLKDKSYKDINFHVIRENTEDFYIGIGGRFKGTKNKEELEVIRDLYEVKFNMGIEIDRPEEIAYQIGMISRAGSERVIRYAFELAKMKGKKRVTSVDKANVLTNIYSLWRDVFEDVAKDYPGYETEFAFVDAITMWFVKQPQWYQVVVAPNMFGDIITDLGAMIQGGLGLAAGGNINPDGVSMFEPIHGSAPKYKGKNVSNPLATILSGVMMLETIGEPKTAALIEQAVVKVLEEGKVRTQDLGGTSKTTEVGDEIVKKMKE